MNSTAFAAIVKSTSKTLGSFMVFCVLLFSSTNAHSSELYPGSGCMPATLGQALNLGFTTNQFGVSNPGAAAFFVVCPITSNTTETFTSVFVGLEYTSATGGTTDCIIRLAQATNSPLNAVPLSVTRPTAGYAQNDTAITISPASQTNSTLVCPLRPGETLIWYALAE